MYVCLGLVWAVTCLRGSTSDQCPGSIFLAVWCTIYMITDLWISIRSRDWLFVGHHLVVLGGLTHVFFGSVEHCRLQTLEWTFLVEASNPLLSRWIDGRVSGRTFGYAFVVVRLLYMGWLAWWLEVSIGDWYSHICVGMYVSQWVWFAMKLPTF